MAYIIVFMGHYHLLSDKIKVTTDSLVQQTWRDAEIINQATYVIFSVLESDVMSGGREGKGREGKGRTNGTLGVHS